MSWGMRRLDSAVAARILWEFGIDKRTDYHELRRDVVIELGSYATEYGYVPPKNANGSRVRCFLELLKRRATDPVLTPDERRKVAGLLRELRKLPLSEPPAVRNRIHRAHARSYVATLFRLREE